MHPGQRPRDKRDDNFFLLRTFMFWPPFFGVISHKPRWFFFFFCLFFAWRKCKSQDVSISAWGKTTKEPKACHLWSIFASFLLNPPVFGCTLSGCLNFKGALMRCEERKIPFHGSTPLSTGLIFTHVHSEGVNVYVARKNSVEEWQRRHLRNSNRSVSKPPTTQQKSLNFFFSVFRMQNNLRFFEKPRL